MSFIAIWPTVNKKYWSRQLYHIDREFTFELGGNSFGSGPEGQISIQATGDEVNFPPLSARRKTERTFKLRKKLGVLSWHRLIDASHQTHLNSLFFLYLPWLKHFPWVFFPGLARKCESPGTHCGSSVAQCLSLGCLLGFQGSGSKLSEPRVTLTFSLTNSLSSW